MPKNRVAARIFNNVAMGATALTSTPVNIQLMDNVAIQLNFTGTPTGTFAVQGSNDYVPNPGGGTPSNAGTFTSIALPSGATASGAANTLLLNLTGLAFDWIQVVYTPTSGSGVLNGFLTGKGF